MLYMSVFIVCCYFLDEGPPAFLKCGEWIYPLNPGQTPVLRTQSGSYMFPELNIQDKV